ncbi:ankyrin repeat domain-containing protein 16 isoform X1 [Anguilla rostrata]|uniref:ankyrin repeat domain-containing protein 16 isoform X1 n=1 Tax=Anguilla rostrata TaxID=7938 RepID=UPI0030D3D2BC
MNEESAFKRLVKLTQDGQLDLIKKEIEENETVLHSIKKKHFGKSGDTLLHYAARHGHLGVLRFFVEDAGMDVELYNHDYKRALHEAASMSQEQCLSYLIAKGAKIDPLKKADWTPLMMACTRSSVPVVSALLAHGANPALQNKDGWNSFHIACREGHPAVVQRLLEASPGVWRTESRTLRTPLHTAALHGCEDVVRILLDRCGYQPDCRDSCGVTPFTDAVRTGSVAVARLLLDKHQASPSAADCLGAQPLHQAALTAQEGALRFLVEELGVDVNSRATDMQLTALHYAAKEGHASTIKTLLELGADLHARDRKGRTENPISVPALHSACAGQQADATRALLLLGLRDTQDASGTTANQLARKQDVLAAFDSHAPES